MNSVLLKHFLVNAVLVLMSFLVLGVAFMGLSYQTVSSEQHDQMLRTAESIGASAASDLTGDAPVFSLRFNRELSAMSGVTATHIFVTDAQGKLVVCSDPPASPHTDKSVPADVMQKLLAEGEYSGRSTLGGLLDSRYMVVGVPIMSGSGETAGAVFVDSQVYGEGALVLAFYRMFVLVAFMVFTISLASSFVMSRRMTAPLRDMAACAHRFAQGRFDVRVTRWANRRDETGDLASAFNTMADALEKGEDLRRGFIANVSHELKTPMTTIAGYIDGILDGTVPPGQEIEILTIVKDEVMRLSRLVRRMMDLSRLDTGELDLSPRVFDACEHIRRVLLGFESRIDAKKLEVEVDLPDTPVNVYADPDSIVQVITNLLDNAVKFSDEGGLLALALHQKGGKVYVSVKNSGVSLPEEDVPFVFERFYKADRSRSKDRHGLGLGLFLVKSLLGAQGQSITVSSRDGMTEFVFTLASAK